MLGIHVVFIVIFTGVVLADQTCTRRRTHVPESSLQKLFQLVLDGQVRTEVPPLSGNTHIRSKGSYKSSIKVNNAGDCMQTAQRWAVNMNDHNAFVTMWISIALLEAHRYGKAPRPSDEQLISTLEFCRGFMDVSQPYNSSLMTFWQCIFDETRQGCITRPTFYVELMNIAKTKVGKNVVDKANLASVLQTFNDIIRIITGVDNSIDIIMSIFKEFESSIFSPDADDTFVWLILGSVLKMFEDTFPEVSRTWIQFNPNISSVFDTLKKYAYRPFSTAPFVNIIDPQTYYVLRDFLNEAKSMNNDVALVTTWFTNVGEMQDKGPGSTLNKLVNDIDLTVCSNVVNAITVGLLSGFLSPQLLEDPEISQIYLNTSSMLAFLINTNITNRPDLALPYYPSRYLFYGSVARTVSVMDIYKENFPAEAMKQVYQQLKHALEGETTHFLLSSVKHDEDGSVYFDEFLGDGDSVGGGNKIVRGEDRIFTTATAANILMQTWLSFDADTNKYHWKPGVSERVKQTINGCIQWLVNNALERKYRPWNAFFSGQNKGRDVLPFRYPANYYIEIPQSYPFQYVTKLHTVVGVQGYVPKDEYEAMVQKKQFGKPTPTVFNGFNDEDFAEILFWSSEPYTYAVTLLAMARFREISDTEGAACFD